MFDIPNLMLTINEAPSSQKLKVKSFEITQTGEVSDIESRLMHLGFIFGEIITIKTRVSLLRGPVLVEVRGRLVALSASEAKLVKVEIFQ